MRISNSFMVLVFAASLAQVAQADLILDASSGASAPNVATVDDFIANDANLDPATPLSGIGGGTAWAEGVFEFDGITLNTGGGRDPNIRSGNAANGGYTTDMPIVGGSVFARTDDIGGDAPITLDFSGLASLEPGTNIVLTIYGLGDNVGEDTGFVATFAGSSTTLETVYSTDGTDRSISTGSVPFVQFNFVTDGDSDTISVVTQAATNENTSDIRQFFNGLSMSVGGSGVATPTGDWNGDGVVDCADLDGYVGNIGAAATGALATLDLDSSGTLEASDADTHITTLIQTSNGVVGTFAGDVNCDGSVNVLGDAFVLVANLGNNVTSYSDGDLNFDGTVNVLGDAFVLVANLNMSNQ